MKEVIRIEHSSWQDNMRCVKHLKTNDTILSNNTNVHLKLTVESVFMKTHALYVYLIL
jgi:hypothetical protein